jgi:superfamily II DNA or RNA helicase
MIHFKFNPTDNRYIFIVPETKSDISACQALVKSVNLVDPICYLSSYKGPIFTNDYIWEYVQSSGKRIFYCSIGLWHVCYKFFKDNAVQFDGLDKDRFKQPVKHSFEEFKEIVSNWRLKFQPRHYQIETAYKVLTWRRSISQLATRAGKTLIAYLVFRYAIEYLGARKILMIVPSVDLVKQGYADFNEYAEFFKTECVWAGGKLVESSNLTIGTFQSLIKMLDKTSKKYNPKFFEDFDLVFVDEVHRSTAAQTKTIITRPFINSCKIIFGMTGTLPKPGTSERFGVEALLGTKIQTITPKELQDNGFISQIHINQIRLKYTDKERQLDEWIRASEYVLSDYVTEKNLKGKNCKVKLPIQNFLYQYEKTLPAEIAINKKIIFKKTLESGGSETEAKLAYKKYLEKILSVSTRGNKLLVEKMMIHQFSERVDYLVGTVIPKCDKNTLILAQHTSYIEHIYGILKGVFPDKIVCKITGAVTAKKREQIRLMMKEHNNVIILASYGTMSTGLTLSNLCYGVLFESFKSNVVNMQSIGRGLGLSELKDKYILYDINDVFDDRYASNKFYLQAIEKTKIYQNPENQYEYSVENVNL